MCKKILILLILMSYNLLAQTGIGTTSPDASAKLDVSATNKGFLPPRISLTGTLDVSTIVNPATGLVIYNTSTAGTTPNNVLPGYYFWDGSKWNGLVSQSSLNAFSGYNPNYAQSNASSVTKSAVGDIVVSQSITTSGRPIQIIATGDANPSTSGAWVQLQIYRDGVALGKKVQAESSLNNENVPFCLNFIDTPTAGTYTYTVRIAAIGGGSFNFGESDGNHITLVELGAWSAGTMPIAKGGTGSSSFSNGSLVFSNGSTLTQDNSNLYFDDSNNRLGIGTTSPNQSLDVNGNAQVRGKITHTDASGSVALKASAFVNAGVAVTLDDIQIQFSTGGSRSLQVRTTGNSFSGEVSAYTTYSSNAFTHFADVTQTINSTFAYLGASWGFATDGDLAVYYLRDSTNLRFYRITLMVGPGYVNNFISIEKLI